MGIFGKGDPDNPAPGPPPAKEQPTKVQIVCPDPKVIFIFIVIKPLASSYLNQSAIFLRYFLSIIHKIVIKKTS